MRIPDYKIDEIRSANDIVEVVSSFVQLKRRGKNFLGLCPFHKEKTPSFTVSPDKQMYHCFGCGKGGNVYTFVMEMEKVSFVEAVRSLAERAGISIPTESSSPEQASEAENLYQACRFAGLHFYKNLTEAEEGRSALKYFHERGFSDDTIRTFGLGYSLNAWDGLLVAAQLEGIPVEHLVKAGLVRSREDGTGHYDYFRGRAMFPIFSTSGRVIAFGARKLREDDPIQGKYINSPETPVYSKSRVVFGLFQSKEAVRSENNALMVEGYADTISLFQAGIQNVVASSGTALTPDQLRLVKKYAKTLMLVYDADSAGSQATVRGVDLALEQGFDVKIVPLPKGEDPDSFVRKNGSKEFRQLLEKAVSFIDFKARQFQESGMLASPESQTVAIRSIVESISKIPDELKRTLFVKDLANRYDLREIVIQRSLEKFLPLSKTTPGNFRDSVQDAGEVEQSKRAVGSNEYEIMLIRLILSQSTEIVNYLLQNLLDGDITDARVLTIMGLCRQQLSSHDKIDVHALINEAQESDLRRLISELAVERVSLSDWAKSGVEVRRGDVWKVAHDTLKMLRIENLKRQRDRNQMELRKKQTEGKETLELSKLHMEIDKKIEELRKMEFKESDEPET